MNAERSYREQFNVTKRIPLHYQKRYWANISNGSFNASLTGPYKQKINTLLKNNKLLALTLEKEREKKEELLAESKVNADLIMFSRLKLARMSDNLKKVVVELDETVSLLEMHSSSCLPKFTPRNTACRKEFKELIKEVSMNTIPEEVESSESFTYLTQLSPKFKICEETSVSLGENLYPISCKRLCDQSSQFSMPKKAKNKLETVASKLNCSSNPLIESQLKDLPVGIKKKMSKCSTSPQLKANKQVIQKRKKSEIVKPSKNIIIKIENKDQNLKSMPDVNNTAGDPSKRLLRKSAKIKANRDPKNTHIFKKSLNLEKTNENAAVNVDDIDINTENTEINILCLNNQTENEDQNCRNALNVSCIANEVESMCTTCLKPITKLFNASKVEKCLLDKFKSKIMADNSDEVVRFDYSTEDQETDNFKKNAHVNTFEPEFPNVEELEVKKSVFQKPYLENMFQEEIVENLANSTLLVGAEVHDFPDSKISGEILQHQNIGCRQAKVILKDIFKTKPLCKSISWPSFGEASKAPLNLQFKHCSSSKLIPSPSARQNKKSTHVEYYLRNCDEPNTNDHFMEPSSAMENEYEDPFNEKKKPSRRRSSMISYKEPPLNTKMRR